MTCLFPDMTKVIPETKRGGSGSFYITHRTKEKDTVRDLMANELTYVPPGTYCIMRQVRDVGADPSWDEVWMSDTPMEHNSNYDALQKAAGDVLVVGLGLGMLSLAMCHKKEVRSVTVLEIEPAVIELVAPHVHHKKLRIILADGKQPPIQGRHFDLIYVDIWPTICSDNWPEMKELLALYRRHRRTGGIVDGWMKDYVQREHNKLEGWY